MDFVAYKLQLIRMKQPLDSDTIFLLEYIKFLESKSDYNDESVTESPNVRVVTEINQQYHICKICKKPITLGQEYNQDASGYNHWKISDCAR